MKLSTLFLSIVLLFVAASNGMSGSADELLSTVLTHEQFGKLLVDLNQSPINTNAVKAWMEKLADKTTVKTDASFDSKLEVRDVALAVLEAITGESFVPNKQGKTTPVKEILAYQVKDTTWRFHIAKLTDEDYETVSRNVDYWFAGYLQGASSKKTLVNRN